MVNLLFIEDDEALTKPGVVRSIYDPTAGTGGMLSVAGEHLAAMNPKARLAMYGQELNPESYAICKADMLIKGQDVANIIFGNTLSERRPPGTQVRLHAVQSAVRRRVEEDREGGPQGGTSTQGFNGRFGPGLPRVSDGSLLFLHAPDFEDAAGGRWRQPVRHRPERLAAVHRRRGLGRERDPPLRAGERPGRGDHRPADRHVLQHRHHHLCLDRQQPQARAAQGQGAADRRQRLLAEDAQEPRQQAQGAERSRHRDRDPPVRRLRRGATRDAVRRRGQGSRARGG